MHENEITGKVIDIYYHLHRHLGPGLLESGFRADIIVEKKVIIEIKSVEELTPVHFKQLLTYLRLSGIKVGLLVNFNKELLKDGIKRIVNNL